MVLAEGIGGSVERFGEMMTKKARDIGATNTHFVNPHGLTAPEHHSTARDLALMYKYALKNPIFREIVMTKASSVSSLPAGRNPKPRLIMVRSHNRMLWKFDGALGGKTGYTLAAQKCFVGAAARNGATVIISMLGSRDLWGDSMKLLGYGLDNYETLKIAGAGNGSAHANGQSFKPPPSVLLSLEERQRVHHGGIRAPDRLVPRARPGRFVAKINRQQRRSGARRARAGCQRRDHVPRACRAL